jgi:hypothetical protein
MDGTSHEEAMTHMAPECIDRLRRGTASSCEVRTAVRHLLTGCPECAEQVRLPLGIAPLRHSREPVPLANRRVRELLRQPASLRGPLLCSESPFQTPEVLLALLEFGPSEADGPLLALEVAELAVLGAALLRARHSRDADRLGDRALLQLAQEQARRGETANAWLSLNAARGNGGALRTGAFAQAQLLAVEAEIFAAEGDGGAAARSAQRASALLRVAALETDALACPEERQGREELLEGRLRVLVGLRPAVSPRFDEGTGQRMQQSEEPGPPLPPERGPAPRRH